MINEISERQSAYRVNYACAKLPEKKNKIGALTGHPWRCFATILRTMLLHTAIRRNGMLLQTNQTTAVAGGTSNHRLSTVRPTGRAIQRMVFLTAGMSWWWRSQIHCVMVVVVVTVVFGAITRRRVFEDKIRLATSNTTTCSCRSGRFHQELCCGLCAIVKSSGVENVLQG